MPTPLSSIIVFGHNVNIVVVAWTFYQSTNTSISNCFDTVGTVDGLFYHYDIVNQSKVKVATLRELLFAEDRALNSNTEAEMQPCVNRFSRACDNFGFTISTKKTEFVHQPAPR